MAPANIRSVLVRGKPAKRRLGRGNREKLRAIFGSDSEPSRFKYSMKAIYQVRSTTGFETKTSSVWHC